MCANDLISCRLPYSCACVSMGQTVHTQHSISPYDFVKRIIKLIIKREMFHVLVVLLHGTKISRLHRSSFSHASSCAIRLDFKRLSVPYFKLNPAQQARMLPCMLRIFCMKRGHLDFLSILILMKYKQAISCVRTCDK